MECWHCKKDLIWNADHDISHEDEIYQMEIHLSCPGCDSFYVVHLPKELHA